VTTIAIQMAYRLANSKRTDMVPNPRVALLELDFENSALSNYLDIKPHIGIGALNNDPDRIDTDLVQSWMTQTRYGFSVFSAKPELDGNQKVNPDTVLALLDSVCGLYDYILIDIPRIWTPWTHATIGTADKFAVVTELTIPALQLAKSKATALQEAVETLERVDFILNKYEKRSFRNSLKLKDAEKTLGRVWFAALASDQVNGAMNRGMPVGANTPDSRFAKDLSGIMRGWWKRSKMLVNA